MVLVSPILSIIVDESIVSRKWQPVPNASRKIGRLKRTAKFEVVEVSEFTSRVPVAILRTELCAEVVHAPAKQQGVYRSANGISDFRANTTGPSGFLSRKLSVTLATT